MTGPAKRGQRALLASWVPLLVIGAGVAVAASGVLGGGPTAPVERSAQGATLSVTVPSRLRSGIIFQTEIRIASTTGLGDAVIGIDPAVWGKITTNTVTPEPSEEDFKSGQFRMHFGPLERGEVRYARLQSQVNPARWAGADGAVSLYDGDRRIVDVPISIKVFP